MAAHGKRDQSAAVFIQSFEVSNLQALNQITDLKLVQLIDANDVNPDGSMELSAGDADHVVASHEVG